MYRASTSNVPPEVQNAVIAAANEAERFIRRFFYALDNSQTSSSSPVLSYLVPDAAIVWTGTPIQGRDAFAQIIATGLPAGGKHDISSLDVHPLDANGQAVVSVSGRSKIGAERGQNQFGFAAVLRLVRDMSPGASAGDVLISSLSYRYTFRPDDATVI
ncbi:uncharacterized protein SAPINGB_P003522 [Magnusiomyces paraingens]|uniref:NTF2 domain-containing protein n=1 Tax=Magnusiomyces paraingens TaxID=2606893 RepID=A0A5E8BV79_9ASCO|nr:uncharacterized protein SAPINGB_P003522 [Saprochaete ingens]VVT53337.1 unnamed protein product [Saprochaete ingens]